MSDWNLEPVIGKLKRRGIIEQREVIPSKKRRVKKNWIVLWSVFGRRNSVSMFSGEKFALEVDAIKYAEKCRRASLGNRSYWVVNEGLDRG